MNLENFYEEFKSVVKYNNHDKKARFANRRVSNGITKAQAYLIPIDLLEKQETIFFDKIQEMPFDNIWISIEHEDRSFFKMENNMDVVGVYVSRDKKEKKLFAGYMLDDPARGNLGFTHFFIKDGDSKIKEFQTVNSLLHIINSFKKAERLPAIIRNPEKNGTINSSKAIRQFVVLDQEKYPKSESGSAKRSGFSHKFDVRGHKRTIKGWGSNQNGEPTRGWTWVSDHKKGSGEYIKKTRVFK